ncbi:MAG TPA: glycoside hydrolase family 2 TIM barrel-domain containing protein [Solirubrobacteraceae bacterium]|nr:glycoside hydrolase family 2 TIM barrel-domain containing protein [Solirubrobacteraceae bacterium]
MRGVNLHEQTLATGAALDPAQLSGLMARVRQLGANVIRAHYPLNPELEEMADRDGILIWSEIPVWGVSDRYLNQPAWVARAHAMLAQNILENQNHPSILLWSVGNELPTPATSAEASYIAGAVGLAHRLDPTPTVALAATEWPLVGCQKAYAALDVIGLNDYFGWFHTSTNAGDRARPVPRQPPLLLPEQGDHRQRVRLRRQPHRARQRTRHLCLPVVGDRLPPARVRRPAMALGRDLLHP